MKPASVETREPSSDARRLEAAVTALSRAPLEPSYRTESAALDALAACVEDISVSSLAADRIRSAAGRIHAATATNATRVDAVSDALATAGGVLTVNSLGSDREAHEAASLVFETAAARLDRNSTLLEQRGRVLASLRAATNLVYLAQSATPPYPVTDEVLREWDKPETFCDAVEQARVRVRALATASDHHARASAADALYAIADVLAMDPKTAAHNKELTKVRLEAFALRHRKSFKGAQGIKVALTHVADVTERAWTEPAVESWQRAARRSIDGVDEGFVAFERAAIQDAVRTVLNVIVVHARAMSCTKAGGALQPDTGG